MTGNIRQEDERLLGSPMTARILRCAMTVHSQLGPGLLESAYRACFVQELQWDGLGVRQEARIPVMYRNIEIDCGYRADLIVEEKVLVELKTVERLLPIHEAQTLTYLKLAGLRVGLLMNFNTISLRHGFRSLVL
jgi:GxxExxY protein